MKYTSKDLIKDTSNILKEKSEAITFPMSQEDKDVINGLHEYVINSVDEELCELHELLPAVGIAAVQVGVLKRMCVVYLLDEYDEVETDLVMINPRILSHTVERSYLESGEGCLSVDEEHPGYVHRFRKIKIRYFDTEGEKHIAELDGFAAIAVQHEIDHLNGILFYDHIDPTNPYNIVHNSKSVEQIMGEHNSEEL